VTATPADAGLCDDLIPFAWHEQVRCLMPAGHDGDHWHEDTGWSNDESAPPAVRTGEDDAWWSRLYLAAQAAVDEVPYAAADEYPVPHAAAFRAAVEPMLAARTLPVVHVHHHDLESHATSWTEGFDDAHRQEIGGEEKRAWLIKTLTERFGDDLNVPAETIADAVLFDVDLSPDPWVSGTVNRDDVARWLQQKVVARDQVVSQLLGWDQQPQTFRDGWLAWADELLALLGGDQDDEDGAR
jgi:hypothetical protein